MAQHYGATSKQIADDIAKVSNKVYTTYVKNGITEWIHNWKIRGWKTANKKPVKNKEYWQQLDQETSRHKITWEWVKGHSKHPEDE